MGAEARRKELAGDLRRKIGGEAAAAVGELRELLEQTNKNMRAIAAGLAQVEKRLDLAAAAPAAIRREVLSVADDARRWSADALEQIEALRLRCRGLVPAEDLAELVRRVDELQRWQAARHVMLGSIFVAKLIDDEARVFDERSALLYGRWAWLRPGRWQRAAELGRMLDVFTAVRLALGIALPTDRRKAEVE